MWSVNPISINYLFSFCLKYKALILVFNSSSLIYRKGETLPTFKSLICRFSDTPYSIKFSSKSINVFFSLSSLNNLFSVINAKYSSFLFVSDISSLFLIFVGLMRWFLYSSLFLSAIRLLFCTLQFLAKFPIFPQL